MSLKERAEQGDLEAQYQFGMALKTGAGMPADHVRSRILPVKKKESTTKYDLQAQSLHWLARAAEHGHDKARAELGWQGPANDQMPRFVMPVAPSEKERPAPPRHATPTRQANA